MLKFDPNLTQLYFEHPFLDRFAAAAADGFKGVEYRAPYGEAKEAIAKRLQQHGLEQVLFNFPAGAWNAGARGIACLPGREEEFRRGSFPRPTISSAFTNRSGRRTSSCSTIFITCRSCRAT